MASEPPKVDAGTVESGQPSAQQANAQSGNPNADPNQSAAEVPNAASASGDKSGPPVELPAFAAHRQQQEQVQAGKLKTPFSTPQAAADEAKKTDFASMSSVDCAKRVILEATKAAVVESAQWPCTEETLKLLR